MSKSARFSYLVDAAFKTNDLTAMRDAYNDWQDSNCLYPQTIKIVDNHTNLKRDIQVPCGRCWHCMQSKINEWCTRMYAHAEDFKHVYFVTLTYRSFVDVSSQSSQLLLNKLSDAVWHKDNKNSTHHFCYRPCLLVKKHYQDFLKRLRKNTGLKDLTYVLSGEYGHKFGAPHFHLILFTNGVLTEQDVRLAWSVRLWRSNSGIYSYYRNQVKNGQVYCFPIGRVDFNDLVSNGTFNTGVKVKVDNTFLNAGNCFSYVCKYVVKRDKLNFDRVKLAYDNLFIRQTFVKCFDDEIPFDKVKFWMLEHHYNVQDLSSVTNKLNSLKYEKISFIPSSDVYNIDLQQDRNIKKFGFVVPFRVFPEVYYKFRDLYSPFCEFSRGVPIGSVYANNHISEFTEGIFNRPLLQTNGFVVPSYFRRKAREHIYGLRKQRTTLLGRSFVLSSLPDLLRYFQSIEKKGVSPCQYSFAVKNFNDVKSAIRSDFATFFDASSKEHIIFDAYHANHYKFCRSSRDYVLSKSVPIADWIRYWINKLQYELTFHENETKISLTNHRLIDQAFGALYASGFNRNELCEGYINRQESLMFERQRLYHEQHISAE